MLSISLSSCSIFMGADSDSKIPVLRNLSGKTADLTNLKGTYTLLHFWSSWCPACKHELLMLQNLERMTDRKNLRILTVAIESVEADVREIRENYNIHLDIFMDRNEAAKNYFQIPEVPLTILIDKNGRKVKFSEPDSGKTVLRTKGPQSWDRPEVVKYFKSLP